MLLIGIRQQGQWQVLGANGRLFVWLTMSADRAQSPSWHTHLQRFYTWKNSEYEQRRHTNQGGCRAAQFFLKCMDFISKDKNGNCQLLQYNGLNIYTSILVSKVHIQPMFIYGYDVEENFVLVFLVRWSTPSEWMNVRGTLKCLQPCSDSHRDKKK